MGLSCYVVDAVTGFPFTSFNALMGLSCYDTLSAVSDSDTVSMPSWA